MYRLEPKWMQSIRKSCANFSKQLGIIKICNKVFHSEQSGDNGPSPAGGRGNTFMMQRHQGKYVVK